MIFAEMAMGGIPRVSEQCEAKKTCNQAMTMPNGTQTTPREGHHEI
jgi:hypothetical protein